MSIQKLAPEVIDQIAAGEVLERPANMIKEFIENSLDAGADEIDLDVDSGGRHVVIKDNGSGIRKEELALALDRHATSKITKSSDLWSLNSYGFRGEALASISSVSRMQVLSKHREDESAGSISSEFGKLGPVLESNREAGTSILVDDLFGNLPARLKFLKSDNAEISAVRKMLKAFALSFPNVSFRLRSGGKLLHYWPQSENKVARCQQVLEKKKMYLGRAELGLLQVEVVFSPPNDIQRNSQNIWFFVQDRWIQDRSLLAAVMAGFENTLMHGEYPVGAVWIYCDPQEVDVNVHPTKSQVKFRDPRSAFKAVREAVLEMVERAPWLENMLEKKPLVEHQPSLQASAKKSSEETRYVREDGPSLQSSFLEPQAESVQFSKKSFQSFGATDLTKDSSTAAMDVLKAYASPFKKNESSISSLVESEHKPNVSWSKESESLWVENKASGVVGEEDAFASKPQWANLQVLGQAQLTYILAQSRKSLLLIDQHAAHERVAFERIMRAWNGGGIEVQNFLVPFGFSMEAHLVEALFAVKEELLRLGIEIEQSGPESIEVMSSPSFLKEKSLHLALMELAKEVDEQGGSTALERKIKDIAATMACHSVVRAGQSLSLEEMKALLEQMDEFPLSSFCPHGRPVFVEYPFQKIDRDFGRIV